jgi:excisionase family DNA binding protein
MTLVDKTMVAEALHVTPRVVLRLVKAKQLPGVKVGKTWKFAPEDVDAFINRARAQSVARVDAPAPAVPARLPLPRKRRFA